MLRTGSAPLNVQALTAAGSTQSTATAIKAVASPGGIVTTGNFTAGLRLPVASEGKLFFIKNLGNAGGFGALNVYPATGHKINGLATNAPLVMNDLTSAIFVAFSSTQWYTFPLLPS